MGESTKVWACPKCGREFAKSGQSHSCVAVGEESLFDDRPELLLSLYRHLRQQVLRFGPVRTDAVKGSINFAGQFHFAAVWPRRKGIDVEFVLMRPLSSRRVSGSLKLSATKHVHWVPIRSREDVDKELLGWLREAYKLRA